MNKAFISKVETELGILHIASSDKGLCKIGFSNGEQEFISWLLKHFDKIQDDFERNRTVANQLIEYVNGTLKEFSIDLDLRGTSFQKRVWKELIKVPYGEVCSYKDLAIKSGSPKGFRAVGMANNKNPMPIIVPCHRVIGSKGQLIGYGGGLDMKEKLLKLEGIVINKGKVVT